MRKTGVNFCSYSRMQKMLIRFTADRMKAWPTPLSRVRGPIVSAVQAFVPPSTVRFAPVIYEDSGPATNDTKAATSSTLP